MSGEPQGKIFHIGTDGGLTELAETPFSLEDHLQGLLEKHPDLLPGDQIDPESPRRWLLVAREMAVPGDNASWALDHLFVDQDGIPTLVEVKKGSNPELRRKVVGQMLDYAANAPIAWPAGTLRQRFESRMAGEGREPAAELAVFLADDRDAEGFWKAVDTNLAARRVRLLFVTDRMVPELRRVVEFLNQSMAVVEVLAVEIRRYEGASGKTLVPTVFGATLAADGKVDTPSKGAT